MAEHATNGFEKLSLSQLQQELKDLYSDFATARSKAETPHGDSAIRDVLEKIAPRERILQTHHKIPFRLIPAPWDIPKVRREQLQGIYDAALKDIAALQIASKTPGSAASIEAREQSQHAKELEQWGITFACLYSSPKGALIIAGEKGMVHDDIRKRLWGSENGSEFRPDVSGLLINVNGTRVFVMDRSDSEGIWPSRYLETENPNGYVQIAVASLTSEVVDRVREALKLENNEPENLALRQATRVLPKAYVTTSFDDKILPIVRANFNAQSLLDMPGSFR